MPRPHAPALALACVLLGACDRGASPTANTATATAAPCEDRVAVMRDIFNKTIAADTHDGAARESDRIADLVASNAGQPYTPADVTLHLHADGEFAVDDGAPGDRAAAWLALEVALARRAHRIAARTRPENPDDDDHAARAPGARIHLALAPAAPIADLLDLIRQLSPGDTLSLVVRDPRPPLPESVLPAKILAAVHELRADPRRMGDPLHVETMLTCPEFRPLLTRTAFAAPAAREHELLTAAPDLALACKCDGVDVEGLTAATWQRLRPDLPRLRLLPFNNGRPDAAAVTLPVTARAADLVREAESRGDTPTHYLLAP